MANDIKVQQLVLRKFSKYLVDQKRFPLFAKVSTYMGPDLTAPGAKSGDSFSVVVPTNKTAEKGRILTNIDSYVEKTKLVTIQQVHTAVEFNQSELMFFLDPNTPNNLGMSQEQDLQAIFSAVNQDFLDLSRGISNYIPIDADSSINARWVIAKNKLIGRGCPANDTEFFAMITGSTDTALVKENRNVYNHAKEISEQLSTGMIKQMNGWNYAVDPMIGNFVRTALAGDDLTVNGASQTGTTLTVTGITAGHKGAFENITIDGVYEVDINTKKSTGRLKQFAILSNTDTVLTLSEEIVSAGQFQNVTGSPANSAKVNFLSDNPSETADFGYYKWAFMFYPLDASKYAKVGNLLQQVYRDPKTGISLMLSVQGDVKTLSSIYRLDLYYAVALLKPEWAVKVPNTPSAY